MPPNLKLVPIALVDSAGNPVEATITGVFQDEPRFGKENGASCPDALLEEGELFIRSERSGTKKKPGDGRVYHIKYSVKLPLGVCRGEATLCVPNVPGQPCVDQGPRYNSLQCPSNSEERIAARKIDRANKKRRGKTRR